MLEQMIRAVHTENTVDGTIFRFGPLGNKSHNKFSLKEIDKLADKEWEWIQQEGNINNLNKNEVRERYYNERFPTLKDLNLDGWKLDSFTIVYDSNEIRMQVAIFTREVNFEKLKHEFLSSLSPEDLPNVKEILED